MAIVKLDKITIYGIAGQRERVLDGLQELGCLHLVNLQATEPKAAEHPIRSEVHAALGYLEASPAKRDIAKTRKGFDCMEVTREVLAIKQRLQQLDDERGDLERDVEKLRPWGDFHLPKVEELHPLQFWFYTLRHHQLDALHKLDCPWQIVNRDNQYEYAVVISQDEPQGMPGSAIEMPQEPLSELRERLERVKEEQDELHWKRVALTRWTAALSQDLDKADDEMAKMDAQHHLLADEDIFALQGWAPRKATDAVRKFAKDNGLALTIEAPKWDEQPPTLLKNPEEVSGAEGAVTFYITPDYHAWDPTWVVYFSFALFFAMIMSDAGYGLLLGSLLAFYLWRKLSGSQEKLRFRNLLIAIIVATVGYGILIGSYFGVSPSEGSLLDRLQIRVGGLPLMASENQGTMMVIAITIGILHLTLANLITAWQNRGSARCLSGIGWAVGLLSGLLLGTSMMMDPAPVPVWLSRWFNLPYEPLLQTVKSVSIGGLIGAAVAILAFSSGRPLFSTRISDWVWRILEGLQALTGVSKAFGDVLSYLRLFALGLASAQLAMTFNELARGATEVSGVGILLAVLIVLVGHGINLLLAIVSGVVHGLRLNCIEFFSWSLTDEGYPFRAFCKKAGC